VLTTEDLLQLRPKGTCVRRGHNHPRKPVVVTACLNVQPGGGELLFPVTLSTKDPVIRTDDKLGVLCESLKRLRRTVWLSGSFVKSLTTSTKSEIAEGEGERIEFTFRGVAYQLDLSNANVAKLEKALAPYIDAATSASSGIEGSTSAVAKDHHHGVRRAAKKTAKRNRRPIARVRQRAASSDQRLGRSENGYSVSARGRIPAGVVEAYQTAPPR